MVRQSDGRAAGQAGDGEQNGVEVFAVEMSQVVTHTRLSKLPSIDNKQGWTTAGSPFCDKLMASENASHPQSAFLMTGIAKEKGCWRFITYSMLVCVFATAM